MKTVIEIHVIQSFAPSNLNRDDTGAPKDALFGGSRRARISSQCSKHAIRNYFRSMIEQGKLSVSDVAVRTKRILEPLVAALVEMGRPEEAAKEKVTLALAAIGLKIEDEKSQYLLFIDKIEIEKISEIVNTHWDELIPSPLEEENKNEEEPQSKKKNSKKKSQNDKPKIDTEFKKHLESACSGGNALDLALFGRMLANMPSKNQNAACQVAHSISTHAVEREFDFFTAIDDLQTCDNSGAGMLGTVEFNSACYYRYSNIDFIKLTENLLGRKTLALDGLIHFIEAFIRAVPSGKQNSFAAHNPPEFVMISVRHHEAPRNLSNAFESAILGRQGKSITAMSSEALVKKAKHLQDAFGGNGETFVLDLVNVDVSEIGIKVGSLKELLEKIREAMRE